MSRMAQERVEAMIFPPEDDELDNAQLEQWLGAFEQSQHFAALAHTRGKIQAIGGRFEGGKMRIAAMSRFQWFKNDGNS